MAAKSNEEVVRATLESFMKGDIDGLLTGLPDEIIFEGPQSPELPYSGIFRGKAEVKKFFAGIGQAEVSSFEPQEYLNAGNNVVVIGRWAGKVRKSGKSFQTKWALVFEVVDGKIRRFRDFEDTAGTAAAFRKS
jgi:ketosteroid isomerase-like protein